jgi:hypothetical protein
MNGQIGLSGYFDNLSNSSEPANSFFPKGENKTQNP